MIVKRKINLKSYIFLFTLLTVFVGTFVFVGVTTKVEAKKSDIDPDVKIESLQTAKDVNYKPQTEDGKGLGYNPAGMIEVERAEGQEENLKRKLSLPESYDLRDVNGQNYVTSVKNQGNYGTCWAFAVLASAESNLMREGIATNPDLSEWHLAYFNYYQDDNFGDPLSNRMVASNYYRGTYGDGNKLKLDYNYLNSGGNQQFATYTLANWKGMANESDFEYSNIEGASSTIDKSKAYTSNYHLDDSIWVSMEDIDTVKENIMKHGAASVNHYHAITTPEMERYYNVTNQAYYCDGANYANHAVTVVGWDDNFSRNNFNSACMPNGNGAWLIKNSWGTSWGNEGYFWISYEDKSLLKGAAYFITAKEAQAGEKNYQYDGTMAANAMLSTTNKVAYESNVFFSDNSEQKLTSISLNLGNADTTVDAWIYTNLANKSNPESGTKTQIISNEKITNMGYYTLDVSEEVAINPNTWFSVVVKKTLATANVTSYVSSVTDQGLFYTISKAQLGESYYKVGEYGNFLALGSNNISLKAQTITTNCSITAIAGTNGQISANKTMSDGKVSLQSGESVKFTMTPNKGYEVADVLVDGKSVGKKTSYTFSNVTANHTIKVTFKLKTYTVSAKTDGNGSIKVGGKDITSTKVQYGKNVTLTFAPKSVFELDKVKVNGSVVTVKNNSYTLSNVKKNYTVEASFVLKSPDTSIANGIYKVTSKVNGKSVLDIDGGSTANGGNAQLYESNTTLAQRYNFQKLSGGYYKITAQCSDKVLDVAGGSKSNGANVQQHAWNNTNAQKWRIIKNSDGSYTFVSNCNSKCIDVKGGSSKNGTNIQMYTSNGSNAQKFTVQPDKTPVSLNSNPYYLQSKLKSSKVVDIEGGRKNNGANVQLYSKNGTAAQKFNIEYRGCGYYIIKNKNSGKVLDVAGGINKNGTNVQQYGFNYTDAQLWKFKSVGSGYYEIISKIGGKRLDVSGGSTANGANIQIYSSNGTAAQRFKFV